jgi:3,4-dihydroxy 2-butanone 4-phosphate synthase/GTP cyclohydrolase II
MASFARGLICLTLTEERCRQLNLPLMVHNNNARYSTNFTVSIEAAEGVTTGISAADRAATVRAAVRPGARPDDILTPGHIFPVMAQPGGVLTRAGHTEAGVDLAMLSGFEPASVICEVLNADGSMARLSDLLAFGRQHRIRIGTIADLIKHRLKHEPTVTRAAEHPVHTRFGEFRAVVYHDVVNGNAHLALVCGTIRRDRPTLVRVHVHHGLYDVLAQSRQEHSWSIGDALGAIAAAGSGVVVILDYNGGEDALIDRIRESRRRDDDAGQTEQADSNNDDDNDQDLRMLGVGSQILADLGAARMRVLGAPRKAHALSGFGLEIVGYVADRSELSAAK